jgi:ABC-type uncharacterized transport system substrate-binding protein
MDEWELEVLRKIDNKEKLDESELSDLVFEYEVDTDYSDNRRWSRSATTISQIGDRYFRIEWENGLTENQPNEFYKQPTEVELKEYQKTIIVKEWVEKC